MTRVIQRLVITTALWASITMAGIAQLSPGDLAKVHAHLEGLANCTQCHTIGKKVDNSNCLACHTQIDQLISDGRGLHASPSVRSQDCFACHSDHHGRNFDMVRFDTDNFDHQITGYPLEGAHGTVDCRSCHSADNISDSDIASRSGTYLGLEQDCLSCHDDFHRGSMPQACVQCHTTEAFKPATGFDHNETSFALEGAHVDLECAECHGSESSVVQIRDFSLNNFQGCVSCHNDVHSGRLGSDCAMCHSPFSFQTIEPRPAFDHATTDFPLLGSHRPLDCASCHDASNGPDQVFRDFSHIDVVNCINCHSDPHEARFGTDCAGCHNESSFLQVDVSVEFDHSVTNFPLEGQHVGIDCKQCHESRLTDPVEHQQCISCHADYHSGQFEPPECSSCHVVQGFAGSTFDIERHNASGFVLEGAHLATPCFDCHRSEEEWRFADIGSDCRDCHTDIHKGFLDDSFYGVEGCASCHSSFSWTDIVFDHSVTDFVLSGAHNEISCGKCHIGEAVTQGSAVRFKETETECAGCHNEPHNGQFDQAGTSTCIVCHTTVAWSELIFSHDSTRFSLDGAHAIVDCAACHVEESDEFNATFHRYRPTPMACIDCHQ